MAVDETGRDMAAWPDGALWQRSRGTDAPEDETERFLDQAAYADDRLDADERDRVAELLARDPEAAADIAAARAFAATEQFETPPDAIVARACALVPDRAAPGAEIIPFPARQRRVPGLQGMARWGSLAAAIAMASWLGFSLGTDASLSLATRGQGGDEGLLRELIEPPAGLLRDLGDGAQT